MQQLNSAHFRKDESLDRLADSFNVAQFVSFSPTQHVRQEFARILGFPPNHKFSDLRSALTVLMERSGEQSLNVRSFRPDSPQSHEFIYGLKDVESVEQAVSRISGSGLHVIVNETIDVHDGGVSGVLQGGILEFAPDDTPRCVEKPGVASFSRRAGCDLLELVYGFPVEFDLDNDFRLEFSLHPKPCGWRNNHLLGWELENVGHKALQPNTIWPNRFSRLVGDKAFGLLIANQIGAPVPYTTVISRRVAPFSFGGATGSAEWWIRTCPKEQVPGKFTTHHGWLDPFALLGNEDPNGDEIASILAQRAVAPAYSGALIVDSSGEPVVEGKKGEGEELMRGHALPEELPLSVVSDVLSLFEFLRGHLGPVRFEWVHDGLKPWVVQLHRGKTESSSGVVVPGNASNWRNFEVALGLTALRQTLSSLAANEGIVLIGQVGLTSHIADVVRKAGKPAKTQLSAS